MYLGNTCFLPVTSPTPGWKSVLTSTSMQAENKSPGVVESQVSGPDQAVGAGMRAEPLMRPYTLSKPATHPTEKCKSTQVGPLHTGLQAAACPILYLIRSD